MNFTPHESPRQRSGIHFAIALSALLAALFITGCGAGVFTLVEPPPTPPSQGPPIPQQSGSVNITPQYAAAGPGQTIQFTATQTNGGTAAIQWQVAVPQGSSGPAGTISASGLYTAPASAPLGQGENVVVTAALASAPSTNFATATVAVIQTGQVATTANPQVASYSIYLPSSGKVAVRFGTDTTYGLNTWIQPTTSPFGGLVTILVAGMRGKTNYHMPAQVTLDDGVNFSDSDHTFTTGTAPITPPLQITTSGSQPPQPGVEMFDTAQFSTALYNPALSEVFATDLQGNVIWTYTFPYVRQNIVFAVKPLANGHFLLSIGLSPSPPGTAIPTGAVNSLREIDLVGNTVHELTMDALNQSLAASGLLPGVSLISFSHDVLALPNGHFVILATTSKSFTNLPGYPGTTNVSGDVLVDVDQNYKPDWAWNTFDHLDIHRHPFSFPPFWTLGNALAYSKDDNNLLFSVRDQNWILKLDFQNGQGSGKILWRLGEGGDFTLTNGTAPDWFYAQHGMNFFSPNTTGVFNLGVMDNGDDRPVASGAICGTSGQPACYSTVPVFKIDETAMSATLVSRYTAPTKMYSFFGGQADLLDNGDTEADFCSVVAGATVQEFLPGTGVTTTPQIVWQAFTPGYDQYRATRLPSLYPGVQW